MLAVRLRKDQIHEKVDRRFESSPQGVDELTNLRSIEPPDMAVCDDETVEARWLAQHGIYSDGSVCRVARNDTSVDTLSVEDRQECLYMRVVADGLHRDLALAHAVVVEAHDSPSGTQQLEHWRPDLPASERPGNTDQCARPRSERQRMDPAISDVVKHLTSRRRLAWREKVSNCGSIPGKRSWRTRKKCRSRGCDLRGHRSRTTAHTEIGGLLDVLRTTRVPDRAERWPASVPINGGSGVAPRCRSLVATECGVGATPAARDFLICWTTARATRQSERLRSRVVSQALLRAR